VAIDSIPLTETNGLILKRSALAGESVDLAASTTSANC